MQRDITVAGLRKSIEYRTVRSRHRHRRFFRHPAKQKALPCGSASELVALLSFDSR